MYRLFLLAICMWQSIASCQDIGFIGPSPIKISLKDQFPIKLLHTDSQNIIITKGDHNKLTKEIEIFNKDFKSIRKVKINSTKNERADHIIWTAEQLILLWEKKVKNKRSLSYQLIGANGRTGSKINLGVIPDGFSPYLRNHQVDIIHNPDQTLFAFAVKDIISKNYQGKNAEYNEFIAIFDKSGKLIEKQQNKYNTFQQLDAYHFISNDSVLSKWVSNWDKNTFQVTQKHLTEKVKQTTQVPVTLPPRTKVISYHIAYNPTTHTMDIMGQTRSHDSIIGMNGIFFNKYTSDSLQKNGQWLYAFDSTFCAEFTKSSKFQEGIILYKDNSLSNDFNFRKLVPTSDGAWYLIQEYYPTYLPDFIKNNRKIATTSTFQHQFNVDYRYNTPLNMSDLIVSYIQKDGTITWSKRVPKSQEGFGYQWGSFDAYHLDNELIITYNSISKTKNLIETLKVEHLNISNLVKNIISLNQNGDLKIYNTNIDDSVFFPHFSNHLQQKVSYYIYLIDKKSTTPTKGRLIRIVKNNQHL